MRLAAAALEPSMRCLQRALEFTLVSKAGALYVNAVYEAHQEDLSLAEAWLRKAAQFGYDITDIKKTMKL